MRFDLKNNFKAEVSLPPALRNASTTVKGDGVDLQGYGSAAFGTLSGTVTDGSVAFEFQESDTDVDGEYTAIADADLQGVEADAALTTAAADDDAMIVTGYKGVKRWVRIVSTQVAGGTGAVFGGLVFKGHPRRAPVS